MISRTPCSCITCGTTEESEISPTIKGTSSGNLRRGVVKKVIDDDGLLSRVEQLECHVASYVTGAPCYENWSYPSSLPFRPPRHELFPERFWSRSHTALSRA